ncbi:MAG: DUF5687 family protein [Porphyromonadaceae bacterium]|nr:DUF5687 family protein [Porphyromonadaceae bacterium]
MIFIDLLKHQMLKAVRAPGYYKNVLINIFLGLGVLYWFVVFLILGFALRTILLEVDTPYTPVESLMGGYIYIVIFGIAMRFVIQSLNTVNLHSYQILPIKRNTLVNYLLLKPLFNPVNYLIVVMITPFAFRSAIAGDISLLQAFVLIASSFIIVWFDILMVVFLKRRFGASLWGFVAVIVVLFGLVGLEYFDIVSLFDLSVDVFGFIALSPLGLILMLLGVIGTYWLNRWFFAKYYYAEKFNEKTSFSTDSTADFSFMNRFGSIGELIALNLKLILRHKRTKSMFITAVLFLAYGLLFYTSDFYAQRYGWLFFAALFSVGSFMLIFGQMAINWNAEHFDYLMTRKLDSFTYISANYYMLNTFTVITFILTTPYFFFGSDIVSLHFAALLYNMGVNSAFYLIAAPFNTKRLQLSKGTSMSFQGTTYKSFIVLIPMMILPLVVINIFAAFGQWQTGVWLLALLGIVCLVLHRPILRLANNIFLQRKYVLCEGFRKKEE